jgi:hypothetical protein
MKKGGVCTFAQNGLECAKIDVNKYCKDQDIEICMLNLNSTFFRLHIMAVYRAPTGDFTSLKRHYKQYCKILTNVIEEAKLIN